MERDETNLAIVDNDRFALQAMSGFLSRTLPASFSIRWLVDDARRAIARCVEDPPDVLLVDMSLGRMDGVQVIRAIRERDAHIGLIAVTSFPLWEYAVDAAQAGAQGIVGKNDLSTMVRQIQHVALGHADRDCVGIRFDTAEDAFARICRRGMRTGTSLSMRELDVVELCSHGNTTADIAKTLGIAEATVNTHLQRACEKLGARNRVHLVTLWMQFNRPKH